MVDANPSMPEKSPEPASTAISAEAPAAPADAAAPESAGTAPAPTVPLPPPWEWTPALAGLAAMTVLLAFLLGSYHAQNSDIWLTLAGGRLFAEGKYVFGVDPFSWASEGAYWANPSWLAGAASYGLYSAGGGEGLVAGRAVLVAILALVMLLSRTRETFLLPAIVLTATAILAASPRFLLQTTLFSFLGLGLLICILVRGGYLVALPADQRRGWSILWQLPLLFLFWSNLDGYYVLGLAGLAMVLIGAFISARADATNVGIAFGLSLVACVLNPHGLHNLTLPNELAYMVADFVPGNAAAAGQTLTAMLDTDRGFYLMPTPFAFFSGAASLAALAFFALALLNFGSFLVAGFRPGTHGLAARALLCLALGGLAGAQARLIPFYAIVAGPITVLNWTDFLRGHTGTGRSDNPWLAPALTGLGLALALGLGWPGWLHLPFSDFREDRLFQADHRASWELVVDTSLRDAALNMGRWADSKDLQRVFNISPDIAHYCAFFAPQVPCGIDLRLSLFAQIAPAYAAARQSLAADSEAFLNNRPRQKSEWTERFAEWRVDHVAVSNFIRGQRSVTGIIGQRMLFDPTTWQARHVDGRTLVSRWSPQNAWPRDELARHWQREAFGPQAEDRVLPADEPINPMAEPGWLDLYMHGTGTAPVALDTASLQSLLVQKWDREWKAPYAHTWQWTQFLPAAAFSGAVPGPVLGVQGMVDAFGPPFQYMAMNEGFLRGRDFGPPALQMLVQRNLRRALLENPRSAATYGLQSRALTQLAQQETEWSRHQEMNPRTRIRHIQIASALTNALALLPDNFEWRLELADTMLRRHYLDAALAQLQQAQEILETIQPADPNQLKMVRAQKDQLDRRVKGLRSEVKRRKEDLDLKLVGKAELDKFREAVQRPWRFVDAQNKEAIDPRGRGLAIEAVRILERINPTALEPVQRIERSYNLILLYCEMGKIEDAVRTINRAGSELGPSGADCRSWVSAATGWYKNLDDAIDIMEQGLKEQVKAVKDSPDIPKTIGHAMMLTSLQHLPWAARIPRAFEVEVRMGEIRVALQRPARLLSDFQTLRGLFDVERGNTATALRRFEEALEGDVPFTDQAIAKRYRELLQAELGPQKR